MSIPAERLDQIAHRFAELEARMASGQLEGDAFVQASRDYAELEPVAKVAAEVRAAREEIASLEEMLADPEMKAMAEEELTELRQRLPEAERQLAIAMLPRDSADAKPAMLEIRAGTGGDEAALFAGDLYRMYERFAAEQGWKVEPVSMSASEVGGFKEVVANVTGNGVFAKLKFGRPVRTHPHLQFPAGPRDRPPDRADAAQAARNHRRTGSWRTGRCAHRRGRGQAARHAE
jgi:peptide chain release factor 1